MSDALFFAEPMRLCTRCHVKRPTLELETRTILEGNRSRQLHRCNRRAHCDALLKTSLRATNEQQSNPNPGAPHAA